MKQLFTLIAFVAALSAQSAHATGTEPAVQTFEKQFGKGHNATWSTTLEGSQVQFDLNGQIVTALYANNGNLLWYKKHMTATQLPVTLLLDAKKNYKQYWIADLVEQSGKAGVIYTLTLENAAKKLVLKSTGGTWQKVQMKIK